MFDFWAVPELHRGWILVGFPDDGKRVWILSMLLLQRHREEKRSGQKTAVHNIYLI
jgi:hypothetical protein